MIATLGVGSLRGNITDRGEAETALELVFGEVCGVPVMRAPRAVLRLEPSPSPLLDSITAQGTDALLFDRDHVDRSDVRVGGEQVIGDLRQRLWDLTGDMRLARLLGLERVKDAVVRVV